MQNEYLKINEAELNKQLALDMTDLYDDPLEFVNYAYPWGRLRLSGFDGPDVWQVGFLTELGQEIRIRDFDGLNAVMPVMTSTTSGHGVGKSALVAWIADFILSTRPHCRGRVSANSIPQLENATWAEISKWSKMMITRNWFRMTSGRGAMKIVHKMHSESWRLDGMAWDEHNAAAFAGLHNVTGSTWYIFDEASEIARIILETAQGGCTDGEPFMFLFSNPTAASGYFFDSHHDMRHRFKTYHIDSRKARFTNKELIRQWIEDYGINSDYVKVRVLGEFPVSGDRQFIPTDIVQAASERDGGSFTPHDPVIIGVDPARYGSDEATIYIRRGRDAKSEKNRQFRGLDNVQLAHEVRKIAERLLADAINVDSGAGSGVIDTLRAWGVPNVNEVNFGGASPDDEYADMATFMMGEMRNWLKQDNVAIDADPILKRQLTARKYHMVEGKKGTAVKIESKEELRKSAEKSKAEEKDRSPDRADGLALTFAIPVAMRDAERTRRELAGERTSGVVGLD